MNTLTIERKTTQKSHTAINLPYYATAGSELLGFTEFYAITGENFNINITLYRYGPPTVSFCNANRLPEDAEQCSESYFIEAYQRAMLAIEEKFLSACPSAKAPEVTLKNA